MQNLDVIEPAMRLLVTCTEAELIPAVKTASFCKGSLRSLR